MFCRNKLMQESPDITTKEINKARLLWVKQIQTLLVTDSKFKKTKTSLGIFVDEEGIYICGGRLHKASLTSECKHLFIIPKDHHITELIIKDSHNKVYHNEVKETMNQVRSQYWITRGQQKVKKIIGACILCKRLKEFHIDHHQQHHYQISELMKKDHFSIQALIIVDLYISEQQVIPRRTTLL